MSVDWIEGQQKAARTARWAFTMTKVRIRRVASRTRWQLVTFYGKSDSESVGVVDMLAIRKDYRAPVGAIRRGDALQIILIQVKGGSAPKPTFEEAARLRMVAKRHCARRPSCDLEEGNGGAFLSLAPSICADAQFLHGDSLNLRALHGLALLAKTSAFLRASSFRVAVMQSGLLTPMGEAYQRFEGS